MHLYIWYPIIVSLSLGCSFMNIPPLSPEFMELLNIDYDGFSWLLSGLFWSHALMQVPAGLIADRLNPWVVLVLGLGTCVVACFIPFLAPHNWPLALGMRVLLGVGTSLAFLGMMKMMIILVPTNKLLLVQGLQGAGFSAGFVIPYLLLPYFGSWESGYILGGSLPLLALAMAFFLPRTTLKPTREPSQASEIWAALKAIATSKPIWILGIFHGLSYGSLNNLGAWLPTMLVDLEGGEPASWSKVVALVLALGAFGRAIGGQVLSWFPRDQAVNWAVLAICILYVVMGLAGEQYLLLGAAILMAIFSGSTYSGVFSLSAIAGGAYAATGMGMMNMIGNLSNIVLTLTFGYVRKYTGEFSIALLVVGLLGILIWVLGRKQIILIK